MFRRLTRPCHRVALVLLTLSLLGNALVLLSPLLAALLPPFLLSQSWNAVASRLSSAGIPAPLAKGTGNDRHGIGDGKARAKGHAGRASPARDEQWWQDLESYTSFPGTDLCGTWHQDYTLLHQKMKRGQLRPKYVTFRPEKEKGLGDQLNGMVTSFLSALLSDRMFVMTNGSLEAAFEPRSIDWRAGPEVPLRITTSVRQAIKEDGTVFFLNRPNFWGDGTYRRRVRYPSHTLEYFQHLRNATNVLVVTNGGILSQIYKERGPTFKALHRLGLRMPYAFGCIVRYLLKPKKEVLELAKGPVASVHSGNSSNVCIHLRTDDQFAFNDSVSLGGGVKHKERMDSANAITNLLLNCARRLTETWLPLSRPSKWLFLSDSRLLADLARRKHPDKVVGSPLTPQHMGEVGVPAVLGVVADWLMFSTCDFYVITETGFAKTSAAFSLRSPPTLVLPLRWDHDTRVSYQCSPHVPKSLLDFVNWSGLYIMQATSLP